MGTPGNSSMIFWAQSSLLFGVLVLIFHTDGGIALIVLGAVLWALSPIERKSEAHMLNVTRQTGNGCIQLVGTALIGTIIFFVAVVLALLAGGAL